VRPRRHGALLCGPSTSLLDRNMAPQFVRPLKLATLAATLWILYLLPWPGPVWIEPCKPAITAVAFALLSWRLGR
jgi:hypothetical protein